MVRAVQWERQLMQGMEAKDGPTGRRWALSKAATGTLLLVFTCFTLLSSGYLAWLYHLIELIPPTDVDASAVGAGYLFQAVGIGITALLMRVRRGILSRMSFIAALVAHFVCAALSSIGASLAMALVFGYAMNLLCGFISAFYLLGVAQCVEQRRGAVFGIGYATSTVMTWLLSMVPTLLPVTVGVANELIWCALFSASAMVLVLSRRGVLPVLDAEDGGQAAEPASVQSADRLQSWKGLIVLACIVVALMSMLKGIGGGFQSADIGATINLESSRLLYAVGLLVAGFVIDWNRTRGAVLCAIALVVPFALLALSGEPIPSAVVWAIDYLFFGFFSVLRVVIFADLSAWSQRAELSGFGLMFGRVGDALGALACIVFAGRTIVLVVVAVVLFVATVLVLVRLIPLMYHRPSTPEEDAARAMEAFGERCGLSRREMDVLNLLLNKRTNPEIADALVVSENTVKFHVRNIMQKTGCKNRKELLAKYADAER